MFLAKPSSRVRVHLRTGTKTQRLVDVTLIRITDKERVVLLVSCEHSLKFLKSFLLCLQSTSRRPSTSLKATCGHSAGRTLSSSLRHRTPRARPSSSSWRRGRGGPSSPLPASLSGGSRRFPRRRDVRPFASRCQTSATPRVPSLWR